MVIEWLGQACLKVQTKPGPGDDVTVLFDPFDPAKVGFKLPKVTADVVAITHDHADHNNVSGVSGEPFVIQGPGEYEVKQTFFYGIPGFHDNSQGSERGLNTIYLMESEGLSVAHLGDFGQAELTPAQLESLEGVDILVIPVGGVYTIDGKQAAALVGELEPRIVIPIHYKVPGFNNDSKLETVEKFIHELGLKAEPVEKFKVSKKDLPQEETKLVLLTP